MSQIEPSKQSCQGIALHSTSNIRTPTESKLIAFARWAITEHRSELGDLGGAEIQEKLVELGLLVHVPIAGLCEDDCRCAEYYEEFPCECLRLVEGVLE